eukprot:257491_1
MDSLSIPPLDMINHYSSKHNLDQDEDALFANQILDIIFTSRPNEKLGFGVRVDETKKYLQINTINFEGEARRVGLKAGDIILAVNDVDVGHNPLIGLEELKKCKTHTEELDIRITVCRRLFDHIMITVKRSGISKCDGKYHFIHLDEEYDSPIFMNQENDLLLLKANYDVETSESLWTISDQTHNYYIGVSTDLMPPNDGWEPIKNVGRYPSPGLVFYNTEQKLIEIEDTKSSDEDEFIDINYDDYQVQNKRMSRIGLMALNDPSSIVHPSAVYEHMNEYNDDDVLYESPSAAEDIEDEWKTKYDELLVQYNESQDMIKTLRENVKGLNASFYDFWLRDKRKEGANERLQRTISQQSKELFEQNRAEIKLINKINDAQSRKKVNSLVDIDLDALFVPCVALEVGECRTMACIESNNNEKQEEIDGLNARISCLYDTHLDLLFDTEEDNELMALRDQVRGLEEQQVADLRERCVAMNTIQNEMKDLRHNYESCKQSNQTLVKELNDLKMENDRIVESKLRLLSSTSDQITKLNNILRSK